MVEKAIGLDFSCRTYAFIGRWWRVVRKMKAEDKGEQINIPFSLPDPSYCQWEPLKCLVHRDKRISP